MADSSYPIEGQIVLLAGTRASIPLDQLPDLLERVQTYLREHRATYDREYERISGPREADYVCAESGHWDSIGTELGLGDREQDAVRRAHTAQFERDGRRLDRSEEFETTLEIRDVLAVTAEP
ncbi:hypothetical protein BVU17_12365 [Haloarcula taiwanensis]|uniref:DUF8048 domain-containing protein n=1 Tax=Haloarcula taiwanensis TaxID=1932004 RepID=A0A2H5A0R4_9EURY|nr:MULTISPECIES: hypothetical protein [Haloarcula]AUG48277.1 hypothetical protein BVU17_12365 [Haloarcula taiwanensis]RLM39634.1 hypothetical protein DVK01_03475 [Haloarcula sp. Atlit-120R]RLM47609.1 hypothetical protein DVK00_03630 [Haloarcula sp. Atlit-47R]